MAIKGNKSHGEDTRDRVERVFEALLDHKDKTRSLKNIRVHDLWQAVNTDVALSKISKEQIKTAFGDLEDLEILIDQRGDQTQGARVWHFGLRLECAHDREASLKEFRQRWAKQWGTGKAPAQKRVEKLQLPTNARTIDYGPYLRSLIKERSYREPELDFELMAQLLPIKQDPEDTQKKLEPLPVLAAMEQYAAEHVLLIGRPGSGKSTALRRLLIDKAKLALEDTLAQIPVLVELRYLNAKQPSTLKQIQDFLRSHDLHLEEETLIQELRAGRFLLLIDGVNELPSEAAQQKAIAFRKVYGKTAMVFSTRDITLNGDLGIHNKLEMQPLSKLQMEQFVKTYLPEQGDAVLRQLQGKLRRVSETPLFLWMLCAAFRHHGEIPSSLGSLFQTFTALHAQLKQGEGASVSEGFWLWQADLLEELAWQMMQAKEPTELQVAISQAEAEAVLESFLIRKKVDCPEQRAKEWLQDLLEHHLLQRASHSRIEFHHQLFQEYYAAKALGRRLPFLSDEELKRDYLNYLKWTEPFGLLLAIIEDDSQALRVVKLALDEVNLMLGAKLSGKVKSELQETTVSWIAQLDIPLKGKLKCLENSQSKYTISNLIQALDHSFAEVRYIAASALGNLESPEAIPPLIKTLRDSDNGVRQAAASALENLGSPEAILPLIKTLRDSDNGVRWFNNMVQWSAAMVLGKLAFPESVPPLIIALQDSDAWVRQAAASALGNLESPEAVPALIVALQDSNVGVRQAAASALGNLGFPEAIPPLIKTLQDSNVGVRQAAASALRNLGFPEAVPALITALQDSNDGVRQAAASALGNLEFPEAVPALITALQDSDDGVRQAAARALGKLGSPEAVPALIVALQDSNNLMRWEAAEALGKLGSPEAVPALISALQDSNVGVRREATSALGKLGSPEAIPPLISALQDPDIRVRWEATSALGKLGSPEEIPPLLISALRDPDIQVQWAAASALKNLGSSEAVPAFIVALQDSDDGVRQAAASALENLESPEAIPPLISALQDPDDGVRWAAASALENLGSPEAISPLINSLQDSDFSVRLVAARALGRLGSPEAIPALISTLQDSEPLVQQAAAEALGRLGSPKEIPALVNAVRDSDDWDSAIYKAIADIQRRYGFYNNDLMQNVQNLDSDRP